MGWRLKSRSRLLGALATTSLIAGLVVVATDTSPAGAAGIVIENPSTWLETRAVTSGNNTGTTIGGTESSKVMRATFVVRHDLSTPVTAVQIETQITNNTCEANSTWYTTANNSGDRQMSVTELPSHSFSAAADTNYAGVGYSLVKFTWNQQAEWGGTAMRDHVLGANPNRRDWKTCAKVRLSDNSEATTNLVDIHLVTGYGATDEDYQYASNAAATQFNQTASVGAAIDFTASIDDPDSGGCADEADGYRIHLVNLVNGSSTQVYDSGRLGQPAEPYSFTRSVTFPSRGRYSVQVEVGTDYDDGDWDLNCDNGPDWSDGSGRYEIGSVDVNDSPAPVTLTRSSTLADPANGGITPGSALSVSAAFSDDADPASQAINLVDWDLSSSQSPRYTRTKQGSAPITTGIASPQSSGTFSTNVPPGDYTVQAGVYDNGSMVASSSNSNTKSSTSSLVVRVANPASAAVSCSPSPVPKNATSTCTATVTDTVVTGVGTRAKVDPTGTVNFAKVAGDGAMTFTPASCTLTPQGGGVSTCSTSAGVTLGDTYTVGATWAGDTKHRPVTQVTNTVSYGNRRTQITTNCTPTVISVNSTTTCTFKVSDIDIGAKSTPLGTNAVSITVSEGASPQSTNKCTLVTLNASESTCSIVINGGSTGGVNGLKTIAASFTGPGTGTTGHRSSSGFGSFNVQGISPGGNRHSTTSSVSCTLTNVPVNSANSCTVTVTDIASGPTNPLGVVTFYTSGGASPNQATCTLSTLSPGVSRCSVSITALAKASKGTWAFYNGSINHKTSSSPPVIWYGT